VYRWYYKILNVRIHVSYSGFVAGSGALRVRVGGGSGAASVRSGGRDVRVSCGAYVSAASAASDGGTTRAMRTGVVIRAALDRNRPPGGSRYGGVGTTDIPPPKTINYIPPG
jgi:hypothetical protein